MSLTTTWDQIQEEIRGKFDAESFRHWFGPIDMEERKDQIILWVPTLFHKDWLDNHFRDDIAGQASQLTGRSIAVKVSLRTEAGKAAAGREAARGLNRTAKRSPSSPSPAADFLNALYTFESFVVGPTNQYAHATCLAVAEAPARTYNPLFIYGDSGLGKTHLMHAIGHRALQLRPETKIIYCSAENFTNEFIHAIKDQRMDAFQKKYRRCDILLVDDVHFLANKDRSQEEFFHTFNELYESSRQLVISSDKPPKEIPMLEDRLRSRLGWGITTDLQPPDPETRLAILRKKAEESDIDIPQDCLEFIAQHFRSNIRDLEGALRRVHAMATFSNRRIDKKQTEEALRDLIQTRRATPLSVEQIQKTVADYFKVTPQELKGKRRTVDVTLPRQVAMFICRELTSLSLPVIGTEFGGRDHTTVLHSCKKIGHLVERDRHIQSMINEIKSSLR